MALTAELATIAYGIVWLVSDDTAGVDGECIVAVDFEQWLHNRNGRR
jgi:hypothetical protein